MPQPTSPRHQPLLLLGLAVFVVLLVTALTWKTSGPRAGGDALLDTVPRDSWLVATLDVAALRGSPLAKPLLGAGDKTPIPGLGSLTARCGFDPLTRLRDVVVTSPENGERGDFGVAFRGDFTREELARCAESVIRGRGGSPVTSTRGAFTLVGDTTDPLHARVAYRDGGPFLVGRGSWLDAMIDATEGKGEHLRREHLELRGALGGREASPAVLVTALLPSSMRDKLKAELGPEVSAEGEKAYAGVLAVGEAGLALRMTGGAGDGGAGGSTELRAQLRCETPDACDEVKKLIERKRLAFSRDFTLRLIGLGPLLDGLTLDLKGPVLDVATRAPSDDLARGIQRIIDFKSHAGPPGAPATAPHPIPAHS